MSNDHTHNSGLSRRALMKIGGIAVVGVWSEIQTPRVAAQQAVKGDASGQAMFLPPDKELDPTVHSRVENLFWSDIMMEHAGFFSALMPGPALVAERTQAEDFQRAFQGQFNKAKIAVLDAAGYAAFNNSTSELIKRFIDYKERVGQAQQAGRIRTLVFSSFFDHTTREAYRALARLQTLSRGTVTLDYIEVVDFWTTAMSDHCELVAHLLDPQEQALISEALDSSAVFKGMHEGNRNRAVAGGELLRATEELIDFQTSLEQGISASRIKSILDPVLANHMARETLKFADELKRSAAKT
jgi:hypothetical protein